MSNKDTKQNIGSETPEKQVQMIGQLRDLKNNEGWKILMRVFDNNIKHLEDLILDGLWLDGKPASESQMDRLRDKRGYMKDLRKSPDNLIKQLDQQPETVVDELDPYYTDMKQVNIDREKQQSEQTDP